MSFVRIRNRLEALERKLGLPLAVIRAPRVAYDVFNDWSVVMADQKPLPTAFQVVQRVRDAGIRNAAFMVLEQYIQRCLDEDRCPEPEGILNSLIPRACKSGLIRATLQRAPLPGRPGGISSLNRPNRKSPLRRPNSPSSWPRPWPKS